MTTITIDLDDYPLFASMKDPEGTIRTILETQHEIFRSQRTSQGNIEMLSVVTETCEDLRDSTEDGIRRIDEALSKIPTLLGNSSKKGAVVELDFMAFLARSLDKIEYNIENVSKTKHSGDVIISKGTFHCMCDTKNYTKTVPSSEVEKIKNDMIAKNINCGLLVSYESGVAKQKNLDIVFFRNTENKLNCLFVIGNAKTFPERITVAIYYLEAVWKSILNTNISDDVHESNYQDLICSADMLVGLIDMYSLHRHSIEKSLTDFNKNLIETIMTHVALIKARLKK